MAGRRRSLLPAPALLLLLLLGLLLLLDAPTPAAAFKLLRKKPHISKAVNASTSTTPTTTTTTDGTSEGAAPGLRPHTRPRHNNVTVTQEAEGGVLVNATLPSECLPVEERCMDEELAPLADTAHNTTTTTTEKNLALQSFCASECGQNYTAHVYAILRGECLGPLPARLSDQGAPLYGSNPANITVVVSAPRSTNITVGGNGVRVRVGAPRGGAGDRDDDHNDNDRDDDDHDEEDENEEEQAGQQAQQTPEEQQAAEQRVWQRFRDDRPGSSLGCIVATDGEYCAGKSGCAFFDSCCYASWVRLQANAGFMLSTRSIRNIEYLCPGSTRFLGVDGCT